MLGLDKLLDESPWIQRERARERLKEARSFALKIINARFPELADLANQKVASMAQPEALHLLTERIVTVPNEEAARRLLQPQDPS